MIVRDELRCGRPVGGQPHQDTGELVWIRSVCGLLD